MACCVLRSDLETKKPGFLVMSPKRHETLPNPRIPWCLSFCRSWLPDLSILTFSPLWAIVTMKWNSREESTWKVNSSLRAETILFRCHSNVTFSGKPCSPPPPAELQSVLEPLQWPSLLDFVHGLFSFCCSCVIFTIICSVFLLLECKLCEKRDCCLFSLVLYLGAAPSM